MKFKELFCEVSLKMAVPCQLLPMPNAAFSHIEDKGINRHWVLMEGFSIKCLL